MEKHKLISLNDRGDKATYEFFRNQWKNQYGNERPTKEKWNNLQVDQKEWDSIKSKILNGQDPQELAEEYNEIKGHEREIAWGFYLLYFDAETVRDMFDWETFLEE